MIDDEDEAQEDGDEAQEEDADAKKNSQQNDQVSIVSILNFYITFVRHRVNSCFYTTIITFVRHRFNNKYTTIIFYITFFRHPRSRAKRGMPTLPFSGSSRTKSRMAFLSKSLFLLLFLFFQFISFVYSHDCLELINCLIA